MEFDEQFLKKLEYLYVVANKVFVGRIRAERRSRKIGSGVEFADHRNYAAGDDLRYLDWSVYGRLDKLLLRLFEEEEDLHIYLLVDASASMRANGKLDYAERICAALAYVGLAKLDRVSIVPFGGGARAVERLPPSRGKAQIFKVFQFLSALEPIGADRAVARARVVRASDQAARPRRRHQRLLRSGRLRGGAQPAALSPLRADGAAGLVGRRGAPDACAATSSSSTSRPARRARSPSPSGSSPRSRARTPTIARSSRASAPGAACPTIAPTSPVPFDELVLRMFREGGFLS